MEFELLPHNKKAYENVQEEFKTENRTTVIHPTGTGKSFIALELIRNNPDKKIVYFVPSLPIKHQLEENMEMYGISSENVEILTYQKLLRMNKKEIEELNPDYIILDEFHHCGAPEWGKVAYELLEIHKNAKVLGLSATPLRYTPDGIRDMVEEIFNGSVASEMSLESAIAEGILNEPTYVTGLYEYENMVKDLEQKIEKCKETGRKEKAEMAEQELRELKKHLEKAVTSLPDLLESSMPNKSGKYIVFCSSIEDMQKKIAAAPVLFGKVNSNIDIMQVSSERTDSQNEEVIRNFSKDNDSESLKLLFCVNMLNEGFHIKDIDGGIMMRATNSPTLYTQQYGRIVAAGKKGETVLIDLVNNIDSINDIVDFYYNLTREIQKRGKTYKPFTVDKELRDIREIIGKIEALTSRRSNVIEAQLLSNLNITFEQAKKFMEENEELLIEARKTNYDNHGMMKDYELLNMFQEFRKSMITLKYIKDTESEEYKTCLKQCNDIREQIILKNIGLLKWIVNTVPELKELDIEDKEEMAIPYLIRAVDTYNPKLKTRENTSLRFDQYAMLFIKFGIENEFKDKEKKDVERIYEELTQQLNREPTMDEIAGYIYKTICDKTINGNTQELDNRFFISKIKKYMEENVNESVKYCLKNSSNRYKKTKVEETKEYFHRYIYGYLSKDGQHIDGEAYNNIKRIIFDEINILFKSQNIESYENITQFDIDSHQLFDSDRVQDVGDGFIQEGVYIDDDELYMRDLEGITPIFQNQIFRNDIDLRENLKNALIDLDERKVEIAKKLYGLGDGLIDLAKEYGVSSTRIRQCANNIRASVNGNRTRNRNLSLYLNNDDGATYEDVRESKTNDFVAYNENLETSTYIQSGELWNVKLSDIVENEEVFQALNEIGMWNLQELIETSEQQLREEYELDDELIIGIKEFLNGLGLKLSGNIEREQEPERETLQRLFYEKLAEIDKYKDMLDEAFAKKQDTIELCEKLRKAVDELESINNQIGKLSEELRDD